MWPQILNTVLSLVPVHTCVYTHVCVYPGTCTSHKCILKVGVHKCVCIKIMCVYVVNVLGPFFFVFYFIFIFQEHSSQNYFFFLYQYKGAVFFTRFIS